MYDDHPPPRSDQMSDALAAEHVETLLAAAEELAEACMIIAKQLRPRRYEQPLGNPNPLASPKAAELLDQAASSTIDTRKLLRAALTALTPGAAPEPGGTPVGPEPAVGTAGATGPAGPLVPPPLSALPPLVAPTLSPPTLSPASEVGRAQARMSEQRTDPVPVLPDPDWAQLMGPALPEPAGSGWAPAYGGSTPSSGGSSAGVLDRGPARPEPDAEPPAPKPSGRPGRGRHALDETGTWRRSDLDFGRHQAATPDPAADAVPERPADVAARKPDDRPDAAAPVDETQAGPAGRITRPVYGADLPHPASPPEPPLRPQFGSAQIGPAGPGGAGQPASPEPEPPTSETREAQPVRLPLNFPSAPMPGGVLRADIPTGPPLPGAFPSTPRHTGFTPAAEPRHTGFTPAAEPRHTGFTPAADPRATGFPSAADPRTTGFSPAADPRASGYTPAAEPRSTGFTPAAEPRDPLAGTPVAPANAPQPAPAPSVPPEPPSAPREQPQPQPPANPFRLAGGPQDVAPTRPDGLLAGPADLARGPQDVPPARPAGPPAEDAAEPARRPAGALNHAAARFPGQAIADGLAQDPSLLPGTPAAPPMLPARNAAAGPQEPTNGGGSYRSQHQGESPYGAPSRGGEPAYRPDPAGQAYPDSSYAPGGGSAPGYGNGPGYGGEPPAGAIYQPEPGRSPYLPRYANDPSSSTGYTPAPGYSPLTPPENPSPAFVRPTEPVPPPDPTLVATTLRQVEGARRHLQTALLAVREAVGPNGDVALLAQVERALATVTGAADQLRGTLDPATLDRVLPGEARYTCTVPWQRVPAQVPREIGTAPATVPGATRVLTALGYDAAVGATVDGQPQMNVAGPGYRARVVLQQLRLAGNGEWQGYLDWHDASGVPRSEVENLGPAELTDDEVARRVDDALRRRLT